MNKYLVLPLLLTLCVSLTRGSQPFVMVNGTGVYGVNTQVKNSVVSQYLGIRFGQSPTGSLRFQKPQAATLPAVVNATHLGNPCWGVFNNSLPMSEDCLFLNVYVPNRNRESSAVPVMVWFHGGAFIFGSGTDYDGSLLAAEGGVIVVVPNYRLGPFGFLSTGDNSCTGNYGLWDQWLALKWVKDNIRAFGGDDTNITIIGESAGAASANFHMTSPYSAHLFHRAILQSGCRQCVWAYNATSHPLTHANRLAAALQCPAASHDDPESSARQMTCVRGRRADVIHVAGLGITGWSPVTDGDFVLRYKDTTTFTGPVMIGLNNYEGGLLVSMSRRLLGPDMNTRSFYRNQVLKKTLGDAFLDLTTSADPRDVDTALDVLDCVYRVENSTDVIVPDEELAALVGDATIVVCSLQLLDAGPTTSSAYLYYFDHYPDTPGGQNGMDHGWDIDYTFGFRRGLRAFVSPFSKVNVSQDDLELAGWFRSLLTNFAKTGNPNRDANWPFWPPYSKGDQSYLSFSRNSRVASHLKKDVMTVWTETIPAILRSQGGLGLQDTRFRHCADGLRGTAYSNTVGHTSYLLFCLIFIFAFSV
ncbi:carboxylesterase 4A-like [Littorina saxatilis]|uniref:carboxylesterase 4A-like n=1 Tax=Littorina saxatilis TaxID=31220 RepID=UPI0038B517FA